MSMENVSIRLEDVLVLSLDDVVQEGLYPNRSALIREAIRDFIDKEIDIEDLFLNIYPKKTLITCKLTKELRKRVEEKARMIHIPIAELIRQAILHKLKELKGEDYILKITLNPNLLF